MQSTVANTDAPVNGWDAFNALDNMAPESAVVLDNLIPQPGAVVTRKGHTEFVDLGTNKPVESVMSLNDGGREQLLFSSNGGIWDVEGSDADTLRIVSEEGTFGNSRFQNATFREFSERTSLIICNGSDPTHVYKDNNGTYELSPIVDTNGAENDGYGDGTFIGCLTFKGRVYYWKDGDDSFYFSQAGSYQGELERFELGTVAQNGGKIKLITSWTQKDSGDGKDDFFVVCFSTGEILIYQGDDPQSGGFWELVGKYYTSEPLSIRGSDHFGSDVIIMTRDGYINLSTVIQQGRTADINQFSRMIYTAIVDRTASKSDAFGWECHLYPKDGLFVFNVPLTFSSYEQHVLNTVTMKWCRFRDMNAVCMTVHDDQLYGGLTDGRVAKLLVGTSDLNAPIQYTALTAYNTFGNAGYQKHLVAAQILSTHEDPEQINLRAYADYTFPVIKRLLPSDFMADEGVWADPPVPGGAKGSQWADEVDSEKGSYWSSGLRPKTTTGWQNVSAYGYAVALLVQFARVNESVTWRNTGLRYLQGGAQ